MKSSQGGYPHKINMNDASYALGIVGSIETLVFIIVITYAAILWARGIFPALLRLGNGLAKRKIAVFAKGDNVTSLKNLLLDSKLFKEKNIIAVSRDADIGRAEVATMYLVFWHDWVENIDEILGLKPDGCALIVYSPYNQARISEENMTKLDGKRHTAVINFRGRLLNDIVTSMITTSYEKV